MGSMGEYTHLNRYGHPVNDGAFISNKHPKIFEGTVTDRVITRKRYGMHEYDKNDINVRNRSFQIR